MTGPVLAVDQGTSGTKALVVCPERGVLGSGFAEVRPRYLPGGLVRDRQGPPDGVPRGNGCRVGTRHPDPVADSVRQV
ncbi:hypothetical protein ACWD4N_37205, partial [Streptomyces sp. NPDC002586]